MSKFLKPVQSQDVYECMKIGDHDYEVATQPIQMNEITIPDRKAVYRTDTGQYLGTVGNDYKPVQPRVVYDMAKVLIESMPDSYIEGVLTLQGGSVFGVSLHLQRQEYVSGDPVSLTFLLLASHNGRYGILGRALSTRMYCLNQLPSSTKMFNLKHTRYVENRLKIANNMLTYYNKEINEFNGHMKQISAMRMTERDMVQWFSRLFPEPNPESKRSMSIYENNIGTFTDLLTHGRGIDIPHYRGTGWHCLNALTEYVNHERSSRVKDGRDADEVKFESVVLGNGNTLMQKGVTKLLEWDKEDN